MKTNIALDLKPSETKVWSRSTLEFARHFNRLRRMFPRLRFDYAEFDFGHACAIAWRKDDRRNAIRAPVKMPPDLLTHAAARAALRTCYPYKEFGA